MLRKHGLIMVILAAMQIIVGTVAAQDTAEPLPVEVGEIILLQGQVLDTDGQPIEGAVVEIWHTDIDGRYNHPNDTPENLLLEDFQYFGTSTTDENGFYAFSTIKPKAYEGRPTHIHVRVRLDVTALLTTQFYFPEDLAGGTTDSIAARADASLFVQVVEFMVENAETGEEERLLVANRDIVVDVNGSSADSLSPTLSQAEGPYYPVIDFSGYDNNLNSTAEEDELVLPYVEEVASGY